ncbi:MAG: hypothetical protein KIT27_08800 [Legionellales bacterium]|nr:hypothetical protein [Legionellales bacterium]
MKTEELFKLRTMLTECSRAYEEHIQRITELQNDISKEEEKLISCRKQMRWIEHKLSEVKHLKLAVNE